MTDLIVALDQKPGPEMRGMIHDLVVAGVSWFKIGVPLLCDREGIEIARYVKEVNPDVGLMLDLKLYDTRDTVLRAVDAAVKMGADMLTVHENCLFSLSSEDRIDILAVGGLTDGSPVRAFTSTSHVSGIVCSVQHAKFIRPSTDKLLVCPGIRFGALPSDNHTMPTTPSEAVEAGADYIVVGRPIYDAKDPSVAAKYVLSEIADASR